MQIEVENIATLETPTAESELEFRAAEKPVTLVTGSAGLIGSKIVERFAAHYRVIGMDVKRPKKEAAGADFVECDLTKDESVSQSLAAVREKYGDRLASVIHLAAHYDFSGKPSPLYRTLTVEGTRRLLRELQKFEVGQFVFSSTLLVMKPAEEDKFIDERSEIESEEETWDYPRSKIEAERVIRRERGEIPAVILRIAGAYDEGCHSIPIAQHIARIYERRLESYLFPGDPDHGQAFVHLNDLVDCFQRVAELRRELGPYEALLIAEPDVMSYADLQDSLGNLIHGKDWPMIRIPKVVAKAGVWAREKVAGEEEAFIKPWMIDLADAHYPIEIRQAQKRLGWEPMHRLRATLGEMVSRLKRDPRRWYEENKLKWSEEKQEKAAGKS